MSEQVGEKRKQPSDEQPEAEVPTLKRSLLPCYSSSSILQKYKTRPPADESNLDQADDLAQGDELQAALPEKELDAFTNFFPEPMVEAWAHFANLRDDPTWRPTFTEEMYFFFGMLLYMSNCPLASMDQYWEVSTVSPVYPMTRYMSKDRFEAIYRRLGAPLKDTDPAEAHELWETIYAGENNDNEIMQFGRETAPRTREDLSDYAREESTHVLLLSTAFDRWDPTLGKVRRFPVSLPKGVKATKLPAKGQPPNLLDLPRLIKRNNDIFIDPEIKERQRASYASPRNIRRSGCQILFFLYVFDVAATNAHRLRRLVNWPAPTKSMTDFRGRLYTEILIKFGTKVALLVKGKATISSLQSPHKATKRATRSYCAYCSSKKRNWLSDCHLLPSVVPQTHCITTGCEACGVSLCHNSKRDCFQLWHDSLKKSGGM
ncbi:MAG: hypothetical protein SEPTF4163_002171 [Sporothrix epigloea]